MSDSEPSLSALMAAAELMRTVRQLQRVGGHSLGGRIRLKPEQTRAIAKAANDSATVREIQRRLDIDLRINSLYERFEEMCRRRKMSVDSRLRSSIIVLLSQELFTNQQALKVHPERLLAFTAVNGANGPNLMSNDDFAELRDTPGIFRHAATNHPGPGKAEEFLRRVLRKLAELTANAEFSDLRDVPHVFRHSAQYYTGPDKAEQFLRGVRERLATLMINDTFAELRDTPGILLQAAAHYPRPGQAEKFLRTVLKKTRTLKTNKEFAELRDTPYVFRQAAQYYTKPGKAEKFLRNRLKKVCGGSAAS